MLSIGIDVSKGKSTVCGMKPGGEIVYTPFEIQHTREGMSELVSLLHNSCEEVRAVLESTGSYHCPVVAALLENGIFVSVVNSLRMKRFCSLGKRVQRSRPDRAAILPRSSLTRIKPMNACNANITASHLSPGTILPKPQLRANWPVLSGV